MSGALAAAGVGSLAPAHAAGRAPLEARSPNGALVVRLDPPSGPGDFPRWSASFGGKPIFEPSRLALVLSDGRLLGPGAVLTSHRVHAHSEQWRPPYGIAESYDASRNLLEARFEDRERGIAFSIVLAAHDDGVAVRYVLHEAPGGRLALGGEATELCFPAGARVWSSRDEGEYQVSAPGDIAPVPHPDLTRSTDQGPLADPPLHVATREGLALCVCESDRLHYPRMMVRSAGADTIATHLMRFPGRATGYSGPGDTHAAPVFTVETPFETPWRVVLVAAEPAKLIEKAGLIPSIATPNRLGDVSWIRPGRAFRIRKPYTTERALACVDFAARRKLDFVEFDAHWYGDGTDPSDATVPIAGLDMARIIAAAKGRGIGMILYVDRVPAMRQLDAILATYRDWGVAGIKFGFVWEGRQEDVDFIYDLVRRCGEHRLLVNLHDNLRPAGLERTLPNYVALEGVRGNEQFPTARHNVTLPFTRALGGPIDYTICYAHERNQTTNAHQLAMAAVYYNPLTFLYWYDEPAKYDGGGWPELRWFDECPTSWHETRALAGAVGEYVAVARRHGQRWFLGAMTNEDARVLTVPLDFLGAGRWRAQIFADGPPAVQARQTPVVIREVTVTAGDRLDLALAPSGGQAILFERG
ncbi:glycoside hydrolase family 97 protein [Sphingomonas cannabina]|uniref:glycoside hydrolase family 97 protein n=1 Tax=Sphingomonas cannabina TaxID=2899123 RepID=UPI001F1F9C35|nr:glycoside hydrolase family 97 protein [Sphingomonas cannabina]UIJ47195.1 glycoside hydrolase family 97 protein [Sphingomonas cannabina]